MGIITVERMNNLFWLGRYVDRVSSTIKVFSKIYDRFIDSKDVDCSDLCSRLGIADTYASAEDFISGFGFDLSNPDSIISALYRAYDNAIIMRDEIGSDVLSYIHMAMSAMDRTRQSTYPLVELQRVIDDLLAFWGCLDEEIGDQSVRNTVKIGKITERIDFLLRFEGRKDEILHQLNAFSDRITTTALPYNKSAFLHVSALIEEDPIDYKAALAKSLEIFSA